MQDLDDRRVPLSVGHDRPLDDEGRHGVRPGGQRRIPGRADHRGGARTGRRPRRRPPATVRRDEVFARISDVLLADGLPDVERRVRIRRWVRTSGQPLVVAVGGSSGVGKSTISQEVADRLGISVVISTDQVRAVIRSVLNPDLFPALSQSSFSAAKMLQEQPDRQPAAVRLRGAGADRPARHRGAGPPLGQGGPAGDDQRGAHRARPAGRRGGLPAVHLRADRGQRRGASRAGSSSGSSRATASPPSTSSGWTPSASSTTTSWSSATATASR